MVKTHKGNSGKWMILVLAFWAALALGVFLLVQQQGRPKKQQFSLAQSPYSAALTAQTECPAPLLETQIPGLFYAMETNGSVRFFHIDTSGAITAAQGEVKTLSTSVTCSGQKIPVTVYYLQQGGKTVGYGLYSVANTEQPVALFGYAFFRLMNLPKAYQAALTDAKNSLLLLVDVQSTRCYRNEKVYTEAFALNLSTKQTQALFSNNARTVDTSGAFHPDWVLLPDLFVSALADKAYFLSAREYGVREEGRVCDLMLLPQTDKTVPPKAAQGVLGRWVHVAGNTLRYLRENEAGFALYSLTNSKEREELQFYGDYSGEFLQYRNWVLDKNALVVTNLLTGKQLQLQGQATPPDAFFVSPNGENLILVHYAQAVEGGMSEQTITYLAPGDKNSSSFTEPLLFSEDAPDFLFLDDNSVLHYRSAKEDGSGLTACVFTFQ